MKDVGSNTDVRRLKVQELKAILKRKSIPYTNERKEELILLDEKAEGVYED